MRGVVLVTSADSYRKDATLPEAKIVQHVHSAYCLL